MSQYNCQNIFGFKILNFIRSRKRRLTDSCGHERCFSCIFRNDLCPICQKSGRKMKDLLSYYLIFNFPPESSQAKVSRMISTNPHLPSSEMTSKLRRSRTEEGLRKELLISREEKSRLLSSTRDESRDSAFFSLNNTSHCLSPELSQPAEANEQKIEIYEEDQVETTLPKPLYLEVVCPTQSLFTCSIAQLLNCSPAHQSCKNVPAVPTSRCYFFWAVLMFGKSTRKTANLWC